MLTAVFDVGWPDAPHRVLRNATYLAWLAAGKRSGQERPGSEDVVASRGDTPIPRYSDAQPTRRTAGDIEAMALYASVGCVRNVASAAAITCAIGGVLEEQPPGDVRAPSRAGRSRDVLARASRRPITPMANGGLREELRGDPLPHERAPAPGGGRGLVPPPGSASPPG